MRFCEQIFFGNIVSLNVIGNIVRPWSHQRVVANSVGTEGANQQLSDALLSEKLYVVASDVTIGKPLRPMDWARRGNPVFDRQASARRYCDIDGIQERLALKRPHVV